MEDEGNSPKRKRGVVLSSRGLKRLQLAIRKAERLENDGNRYKVEQLSERIGVSKASLNRLWSATSKVDRKTVRIVFSSFGLN